jgi:hypothetical protein
MVAVFMVILLGVIFYSLNRPRTTTTYVQTGGLFSSKGDTNTTTTTIRK